MKRDPIEYNETDFEENIYDFFTFLLYKGQPFSGTLKEGNWLIEFENGHADGRSINCYDDGKLESDEIYEKGRFVEGKHWHPNGQLKYDSTENKQWDENGQLICENGHWLFSNGNPKQKNTENGCLYLAPNNSVVFEVSYKDKGDYKNTVTYNDENLFSFYNDILLNQYEELDTLFDNTERYFWGWIWKLFDSNQNKAFQILTDLSAHPNPSVAEEAIELRKEMNKKGDKNTWKNYGYHITP